MVYTYRAFIYKKKQEYGKAISDFNKAIELDSQNAAVYTNSIGVIYLTKEEYGKAITCFNKAIQLDPQITNIILQHWSYAQPSK